MASVVPLLILPTTQPTTPQPVYPYPATKVIHMLIDYISSDACSFRHNPQSMKKLVKHARGLYDEINQRICEVDQTGDWEVFDTYSQAIDPLEEALLGISPSLRQDPVTAPSVEGCAKSVTCWVANRESLRFCLHRLRTEAKFKDLMNPTTPQESDTDISSAYAQDDRNLFKSLLGDIHNNKLKIKGDPRISLKNALDGLNRIQAQVLRASDANRELHEELVILSIKTAMLIHEITKLMLDKRSSQETHNRLQSDVIWHAVKDLVHHLEQEVAVYDSLKSFDSVAFDKRFEKEYKTLETILLEHKEPDSPRSPRTPLLTPTSPAVPFIKFDPSYAAPGARLHLPMGRPRLLSFGMKINVTTYPTNPGRGGPSS